VLVELKVAEFNHEVNEPMYLLDMLRKSSAPPESGEEIGEFKLLLLQSQVNSA
jgi:hypothetical protein